MGIITVEDKEIEIQNEYMKKVKDTMNGKKYFLFTMGCQLNENESEKLSGMISCMGYLPTLNMDEANLIVLNTCCVRENAENKILGHLGLLKVAKEKKQDMIIALCGCMAQEPVMIEKFNKTYGKHIDIIFGTHNLYKFPELLYNTIKTNKRIIDVWDMDGTIAEGLPIKREGNIKASVTIMYGCNNFCTYCIVPYVRGRERSRGPENILKEIGVLADEGFKEITLLGQNVNSYGKDLAEPVTFAELLKKTAEIEGIERIRFVTPHPKDFSDELIEVIASKEKVCKVIHLPVQAGSDNVLKKMNRKYTKEQYLNLVNKIKAKIPSATFSTDIIVGFPGETDEDFEDTLDVVRKVKYDSAFTYVYSKRVGTPAEKMEEQIDEEKKKERIGRLIEVVNEILEEQNEKLVGTIQRVLVEGYSKNSNEFLTGRTDGGKVVNFEGSEALKGSIVNIRITAQRKWYLAGILCD